MNKDPRLGKNGFFNIRGYLKLLEINPIIDSFFLTLNCERNNGKSTNVWEYVISYIEYFEYKRKFVFIRNTDTQMKNSIKDFNNWYPKKYRIIGNVIYKLSFFQDGKENINERILVGKVAPISTFLNFKSNDFNNFHLIFWDEYNDNVEVPQMYEKMINLLTTIKRKNLPFQVILIGNKDNANNPIMLNLGIEKPHNPKKDKITILNEAQKMFFIDVGSDTYKGIKQKEDIISTLASFNHSSNRYLNKGGYIIDFNENIINYQLKIYNQIQKLLGVLVIQEISILIGFFKINGVNSLFIHKLHDDELTDYMYLNFYKADIFAEMNSQDIGENDDDDLIDLAEFIYQKSLKQQLYFTDFDTKKIIIKWITSIYK